MRRMVGFLRPHEEDTLRVHRVCLVLLAAGLSVAPAAADPPSGATAAKAVFTTYIREGLATKNVSKYEPYFSADFYRLTVHWLHAPQKTGKLSYECGFDADPVLGIQNGAPKPPVTVGAPGKLGSLSILPVTVQLMFNGPKTSPHVTDVSIVTEGGVAKIADILPVVDGKANPKYSMRASLERFAKDPECR